MSDPTLFSAARVSDDDPMTTHVRDLEQAIADLRDQLHEAAQRERALRNDLRHRVRNMLAVIRSVFRRSRESGASQEELVEHFGGRLDAIARLQSGLVGGPTAGLELEDLVRDELLNVHCDEGSDCRIEGSPVRLHGKVLELVGLAIHELTTNSVKFGALGEGGALAIEWSLDDADGHQSLRLRWRETGVSILATAPRPSGFGRQLIEEALPYELDATVSYDLKPGGVDCLLVVPLPAGDTPAGTEWE